MRNRLREAVSTAYPGSMAVIGCLDGLRRHQAMGSSSKQMFGDQVRVVEDSGDMGLSRSVSEGRKGRLGGFPVV